MQAAIRRGDWGVGRLRDFVDRMGVCRYLHLTLRPDAHPPVLCIELVHLVAYGTQNHSSDRLVCLLVRFFLPFTEGARESTEHAVPSCPCLHTETAPCFICHQSDTTIQSAEASPHAMDHLRPRRGSGSPKTALSTGTGDAATTSSSMSAPEIQTERSLSTSPIAASPSYNPASSTSSLNMKSESSCSALEASSTAHTIVDVDPDAQILEALRSKDRIYVLKLGEQMEGLIKERRYVSVVFFVHPFWRHTTMHSFPHGSMAQISLVCCVVTQIHDVV